MRGVIFQLTPGCAALDFKQSPPPPLHQHHGLQASTDIALRLAVGVALVPIGALIALTGDRTQKEGENTLHNAHRGKKMQMADFPQTCCGECFLNTQSHHYLY